MQGTMKGARLRLQKAEIAFACLCRRVRGGRGGKGVLSQMQLKAAREEVKAAKAALRAWS